MSQIEERGVKTDYRSVELHAKYGFQGIKKMFSKVVATKNHYLTEKVVGNRRLASVYAAMEKKDLRSNGREPSRGPVNVRNEDAANASRERKLGGWSPRHQNRLPTRRAE